VVGATEALLTLECVFCRCDLLLVEPAPANEARLFWGARARRRALHELRLLGRHWALHVAWSVVSRQWWSPIASLGHRVQRVGQVPRACGTFASEQRL
jgi:hypothetical protein